MISTTDELEMHTDHSIHYKCHFCISEIEKGATYAQTTST